MKKSTCSVCREKNIECVVENTTLVIESIDMMGFPYTTKKNVEACFCYECFGALNELDNIQIPENARIYVKKRS